MKVKLMWVVCWALFWTGDIISRVGHAIDKTPLAFLSCVWYPMYCWFMGKSCEISDHYKFDVWSDSV